MTFDFDHPPDRAGTDSQKWQKYAGRDILPMWVADMDFKVSPAIVEALHERVDQGIFGYARPVNDDRRGRRGHGATLSVVYRSLLAGLVPGLVVGLNVTAQAFAAPAEEVLTLAPVYPPFMGFRSAK